MTVITKKTSCPVCNALFLIFVLTILFLLWFDFWKLLVGMVIFAEKQGGVVRMVMEMEGMRQGMDVGNKEVKFS